MSKPWALSVDTRGFYDDNYLTQPRIVSSASGTRARPLASWGYDIAPSAAINHSAGNTFINASYIFDARHYETHDTMDYTHQFNGHLEHQFGEHYKLSVNESFVVAQEPTVIDPSIITEPFRIPGYNKRNTGQVDFTAFLTKDFDLRLGYGNTLYAYQQTARSVIGYGENTVGGEAFGTYSPQPSRSALLDRMEHLATLDLMWKATPKTTGVLGYEFGHTDYTAPEYILFPSPPYNPPLGYSGPPSPQGYMSNIRNNDSHYVYVGADELFTSDLNASIRAGAEYVDYYRYHTSRLSPYVDAGITYKYLPDDTGRLGVKHVHNATDVVDSEGGPPVLDEQTTAVYLSESHTFSKKFTITLTGQVQDSTFVGGGTGYDAKSEDFFVAQLNFAYHFTPWLLAETGYNYSRLTSELALREYTRNFGYLGLSATWGP